MDFASIRVITDDIKRLVRFYETVTGLKAAWLTDAFAELATPHCTLAIGHSSTLQFFGDDVALPGANKSVIIEFRVADVDADYKRLGEALGKVVQEPTTMPWGNRSLLFRDPDGNLVNFFTPVSPEAKKKYGA